MESPKYNTVVQFELLDGRSVPMTLAFYILYQLKAKNKSLYERYMAIMAKKHPDELEMLTVLYTAYVCAGLSHMEDLMSEHEFIVLCGSDRLAVYDTYNALTAPKKKTASENLSGGVQSGENTE